MKPLVVTHGGAGAKGAHSDGCVAACKTAMQALGGGQTALMAAVAAVRVLEDDPRFNAGCGAAYRLDGETIQLDAGVADEDGFGAVANLERVRHPVDVALFVRRSPHTLLAGPGAQALARKLGVVEEDVGTAERKARVREIFGHLQEDPRWRGVDVEAFWNFDAPMPRQLVEGTPDTVGAVVRDGAGHFAAAGSTGGTAWSLRGRIGDTPIFGAGMFVGTAGALVATGIGEELWRRLTCKEVHDAVARGMTPQQAIDEHVRSFRSEWDIGVLCVGSAGWGAASNRDMPWAAMEGDLVVGSGQ